MDQDTIITIVGVAIVAIAAVIIFAKTLISKRRGSKNRERALKMVPMLIHLPPSTDDIDGGGRDERDVANEEISEAQVMYNIIASTLTKGLKSRIFGQRHLSFEIVAHDGFIKYYAVIPMVLVETIRQAIMAAYPTARLEEVDDPNFFSKEGGMDAVAGGELSLKESFWYPIASYEDTKRDASLALLNAMSTAKVGDGIGLQILIRPTDGGWVQKSIGRVSEIRDGKKKSGGMNNFVTNAGSLVGDLAGALWRPPEEREGQKPEEKILTNLQQEEIQRIEEKTKYPGFEVFVRFVASSSSRARSEALLSSVVSVFSQFDLQNYNGFRYDAKARTTDLVKSYIMREFDQKNHDMILNSVELSSIFHLPSQKNIPTSQVERQMVKQVDGPAKLAEDGIILGVNEFRGEKKVIRLRENDRRRHTYAIGATGSGKSVFLENLAYQDMCDGRGFCFIDPHGDAVEWLLSRVPPERMDDVIVFEPGYMDRPVGMNMFEFQSEDQKDFIVQESINMLVSLYDPGNQGIFGARAQHMFRNAALLLMSDPNGGTFIDVPRCFIDPEFVKEKLQYVTDRNVYDYWTKEFPASQKSSDAGEVTTWFVSKWGPFLSNKMMRNILGQTKSGFNIREVMDNKKILLVNLSKGTTGELNAKLLGMIFVMKFQAAAMSRADIKNVDDRVDFCLFVDEFQNFATESFESILSEARKYRLNLILANQFMTQLTDKIREAIIGNVGTIMSGRIGVTDAELIEKVFAPTFTAMDLHNQPNYNWIARVMMFDTPTSPFTLKTLPPMGDGSEELMKRMKEYALSRHGRPRAEVEAEIDARTTVSSEKKENEKSDAPAANSSGAPVASGSQNNSNGSAGGKKKSFLDAWLEKRNNLENNAKQRAEAVAAQKEGATVAPAKAPAKVAMAPAAPAAPVAAPAVPAPATTPAVPATPVAPAAPAAVPVAQGAQTEMLEEVEELVEENNGSLWVAAATQNAVTAAQTQPRNADNGLKIQHDRVAPPKRVSVPQTAVSPSTAPKAAPAGSETPKTQNNANGSVTKEEDGVVLRWR